MSKVKRLDDYRKGNTKISVLPTLLFTVSGKIEDVNKMTSFTTASFPIKIE